MSSNPTSSAPSPSPAKRPFVFYRDGHVYSSLTSDYLPPVPEPLLSLDTDAPYTSQCQKPRWVDPRYPYFAFTPVHPQIDIGPFSCLHRYHIRAERITGGWKAPSGTIRAFIDLEFQMCHIAAALFKKHPPHMLEMRIPPPPSNYGYRCIHRTKKAARTSVWRSRDAFFVYMGWLSYLITFNDNILLNSTVLEPEYREWEEILMHISNPPIPVEYIQKLRRSKVYDFSCEYKRAGVFIELDNWPFHHLVRRCVKHNVPVWMRWATDTKPPAPLIADHYPTAQEVVDAVNPKVVAQIELGFDAKAQTTVMGAEMDDGLVETSASYGLQLSCPPQQPSRPEFPTPDLTSRQRHGETMQQFMEHSRVTREKFIRKETDAEREIRLDRETVQATHPLPGIGGPKVFHWEEDAVTGIHMRMPVSRAAILTAGFWPMYSNKQREYNPIFNEWDVCTLFEKGAELPNGDGNSASNDSDIGDLDKYLGPPEAPLLFSGNEHLRLASPTHDESDLTYPPLVTPSFENFYEEIEPSSQP